MTTRLVRMRDLFVALIFGAACSCFAAPVDINLATRVAEGILSKNTVAKSVLEGRTVDSVEAFENLWVAHLAPSGHIILAGSTKCRPIVSFSIDNFAAPAAGSHIADRLAAYSANTEEFEADESREEDGDWARYAEKSTKKRPLLGASINLDTNNVAVVVGPLIGSNWHQGAPYNDLSPLNSVPCGCSATAGGQELYYWKWPHRMENDFTFVHTLNGVANSYTNRMNGLVPFDWDKMRDNYKDGNTDITTFRANDKESTYAAAHLVNWVQTFVDMKMGNGGSGAYRKLNASEITKEWYEKGYDLGKWKKVGNKDVADFAGLWTAITNDIAFGSPINVNSSGHQMVVEGYALDENGNEYICLNYGWGSKGSWVDLENEIDNGGAGGKLAHFQIGFRPKKRVQFGIVPKVSTNSVELVWYLPHCYTNRIDGFEFIVSNATTYTAVSTNSVNSGNTATVFTTNNVSIAGLSGDVTFTVTPIMKEGEGVGIPTSVTTTVGDPHGMPSIQSISSIYGGLELAQAGFFVECGMGMTNTITVTCSAATTGLKALSTHLSVLPDEKVSVVTNDNVFTVHVDGTGMNPMWEGDMILLTLIASNADGTEVAKNLMLRFNSMRQVVDGTYEVAVASDSEVSDSLWFCGENTVIDIKGKSVTFKPHAFMGTGTVVLTDSESGGTYTFDGLDDFNGTIKWINTEGNDGPQGYTIILPEDYSIEYSGNERSAVRDNVTPAANEPVPVAVWEGDFTAPQAGYSLDRGNNALSDNNSKITIGQDVGVKVDFTTGMSGGMTVMFKYANLDLSRTNTLITSFVSGQDENRTGVYLDADAKANGIWNTTGRHNKDADQKTAGDEMSSGTMVFYYQNKSGTTLHYLHHTICKRLFNCSSLKSSDLDNTIHGCTIGGERAKTGATLFPAAEGLEITGIAIFRGKLTREQMAAYIWPSEVASLTVSASTATVSELNTLIAKDAPTNRFRRAEVTIPADATINIDSAFSVDLPVDINSEGNITLSAESMPPTSYFNNIDFIGVKGAVFRSWLAPGVVGFNFYSTKGRNTSSALVASSWYENLTDKDGTYTEMFADGLSALTWSSSNCYGYQEGGILNGYLDDGANGGNGVTINLSNMPYESYDVIIYASTDTENADFTAKTVNGKTYTWNADTSSAVEGTDHWGASRRSAPTYGVNALRIENLTGPLTIYGGAREGNTRGGIAAIQIVPPYARLTLDEDSSWSAGNWTDSHGDSIPAPVNACVEIVATNGIKTLTMDADVALGDLLLVGDQPVFKGSSTIRFAEWQIPSCAVFTNAEWTGTNIFTNCGHDNNSAHTYIDLSLLGNDNSFLKMPGYKGYLANDRTCSAILIIDEGTEFNISDGDSGHFNVFKKVVGSGKFVISGDTSATFQAVVQDASEFTGEIQVLGEGFKGVVLGASDDWVCDYENYQQKVVIAGDVTIASGKTWDLADSQGVVVLGSGTLNFAGIGESPAILGQLTLASSATVKLPAGTSIPCRLATSGAMVDDTSVRFFVGEADLSYRLALNDSGSLVYVKVAQDSAENEYETIAAALDAIQADQASGSPSLAKTITLIHSTGESIMLPYGYTLNVGSTHYTGNVTCSDGLAIVYNKADGTYICESGNSATWIGGDSGSWSESANWSSGTVPTSTTTVTFTNLASDVVVSIIGDAITEKIYAYGLVVESGKTVTFQRNGNAAGTDNKWGELNIGAGAVSGGGTVKLITSGIQKLNDNSNFTIDANIEFYNGGNDSFIENANGTVVINGTVTGTGFMKVKAATTFNGNVTIPAGSTLQVEGAKTYRFGNNATLSGDGTLVFEGAPVDDTIKDVLQDSANWTGTCELKNISIAGCNLSDYGNVNSYVAVNGLDGFFNANHPVSRVADGLKGLKVMEGGLINGASTTDHTYVIAAELIGDGPINLNAQSLCGNPLNAPGRIDKFVFTGATSNFTGQVKFKQESYRPIYVFAAESDLNNLTVPTDYGQIIVMAGKTLDIAKEWNAPGGFIIDGDVRLSSTASLTGVKPIAGNGKIVAPSDSGWEASRFSSDWTGEVICGWTHTTGAFNPSKYGSTNSTVTIKSMTSGCFAQNYGGTINVAGTITTSDGYGDQSGSGFNWNGLTTFNKLILSEGGLLDLAWGTGSKGVGFQVNTLYPRGGEIKLATNGKTHLRIDTVNLTAEPANQTLIVPITANSSHVYNNDPTPVTNGLINVTVTVDGETTASTKKLFFCTNGLYVAVAAIGNNCYTNLADAVVAAGTEDVINLLADTDETIMILVDKTIQIRKNGFDCTGITSIPESVLEVSSETEGVTTYTSVAAKAAVIGDSTTYYTSLSNAVEAASSDVAATNTVRLLANDTGDVVLNNKAIIFNQNGYTFTGSLSGNGTMIVTNSLPTLGESGMVVTNDTWQGVLWLKNITYFSLNPTVVASENSTLRLTGCTGYFNAGTCAGTLDLQDEGGTKAFVINNGAGSNAVTVFEKLTGNGSLGRDTKTVSQRYVFKDASGFAGEISCARDNGNKDLRVILGDGATLTPAEGTITVVTNVTIAAGKTWTASSVVIKSGATLDLSECNSTTPICGELSLEGAATIVLPQPNGVSAIALDSINFPSGTVDVGFTNGASIVSSALIDWSAGGSTPSGNFNLVGEAANRWMLVKSDQGLSITNIAAKLTRSTGEVTNYYNVDAAITALQGLRGSDFGASVTVLNGAVVSDLAAKNLAFDNGVYVQAAAKIGADTYASVPAALNAASNTNVTMLCNYTAPTISIPATVTLEVGVYTLTGTLVGSGTVVYDDTVPAFGSAIIATDNNWQGVVWLKNATLTNLDPAVVASANSTLRLTGCTGYFNTGTCAGKLDLQDEGVTKAFLVNGDVGEGAVTVFEKLTGGGSLGRSVNNVTQRYVFKDASGFTGAISCARSDTGDKDLRVILGDGATLTPAEGTITVAANVVATIAASKTWVTSNCDVRGTLKLNSGANVSSNVTVKSSAILDLSLCNTTKPVYGELYLWDNAKIVLPQPTNNSAIQLDKIGFSSGTVDIGFTNGTSIASGMLIDWSASESQPSGTFNLVGDIANDWMLIKSSEGLSISNIVAKIAGVPYASFAEAVAAYTGSDPIVVVNATDADIPTGWEITEQGSRLTKIQCTITWNNDDNTTIDTTTVEYGAMPSHTDVTKAADAQYTYTFTGWTPTIVAVTGDATYTATYSSTVNQYTVTFVDENGTTVLKEATAYDYNTPAGSIEAPTATKAADAQYIYTFAGWDPELETVKSNTTYTATYNATVNKYTVTFVDEDGTTLKEATAYDYNTPAGSIEAPTATKAADAQYIYTFAGWDPELETVKSNTTYTATYNATVNKYTVTFVDENGTTVLKEVTECPYGRDADSVKPSNPTKAADAQYTYTFAGWDPELETVKSNTTYTATYNATKNKYTVTFNDEDGTEISSADYDYGTAAANIVKPADPTKAATAQYTYTFSGWTPTIETVTGAATYTATYIKADRMYDVTVEGVVTQVTYGSSVTFTAPAPVVDGTGKVQTVCVGTSTYPDKGTNFTLTVEGNITFSWDTFETNYWFESSVTGSGSITGAPANGWVPKGTNFTITAVAAADNHFVEWTGETDGCDVSETINLLVRMDCPREIGARFAADTYTENVTANKTLNLDELSGVNNVYFTVAEGVVLTLTGTLSVNEIRVNGLGSVKCSAADTLTGTLKGSGTVVYGVKPDLGTGKLVATDNEWSGVIWIKGTSVAINGLVPTDCASTNSTLRLTGCSGYFNVGDCAGTLDLRDDGNIAAFTVTNGYSTDTPTSFANLIGDGTFYAESNQPTQKYRFGAASEFNGTINIESGANKMYRVLIGDANTDSSTNGTITIATNVTIAASKTWSAPGGVNVLGSGKLCLDGTGSIVGGLTFEPGSTVQYIGESSGTSIPLISATSFAGAENATLDGLDRYYVEDVNGVLYASLEPEPIDADLTPVFGPQAVAVWDGNFRTNALTAYSSTGYTLVNSNATHGLRMSSVTIDQDKQGLLVDFAAAKGKGYFTVLVKYSNLTNSLTDKRMLFATTANADRTRNRCGVRMLHTGNVNGLWNSSTTENSDVDYYDSSTSSANTVPSSGTLAFVYSKDIGTFAYVAGSGEYLPDTALWSHGSLKAGNMYGFAIGGNCRDGGPATGVEAAKGMTIEAVAVFDEVLTVNKMNDYIWPSYPIATTNVTGSSVSVSDLNTFIDNSGADFVSITVDAGATIAVDEAFRESVEIIAINSEGSITLSAESQPPASWLAKVDFSGVKGSLYRSWLEPGLVGFNFNSDNRDDTSVAIVPGGTWVHNASDAWGTSTNLFADGLSELSWSSANLYQYTGSSILNGYLDDGSNHGNGAEIILSGVPYEAYDVIIYAATDSGDGFLAKTVNGTNYTWSAGAVVEGDGSWGTTGQSTAAYGTNAMRINNLSGQLTIYGGVRNGNARGGISAIQIMPHREFTVNFNAGLHGTLSSGAEQTIDYGEKPVAPTPTSDEGWIFSGWDSSALEPVFSDATFTAQYTPVEYTITYNEVNGADNTANPETFTVTNSITFAALGNVEGWNFTGWSPASITAGTTHDVTVTANWERPTYECNINGVKTNFTYGTSVTFTAPEPVLDETEKVQTVCVGTSTYPDKGTNFTLTVESDITFSWDILATNYWFETSEPSNGSIVGAPDEGWLPDGTNFTLTAVADANYHLVGWTGNTNGCEVSETTNLVVSMDFPRTIGATFAIDQYTVTFKNYDETELLRIDVAYGETPVYTGVTPTRPADDHYVYEFAGWDPEVVAATGEATYISTYREVEYYTHTISPKTTWFAEDASVGDLPQTSGASIDDDYTIEDEALKVDTTYNAPLFYIIPQLTDPAVATYHIETVIKELAVNANTNSLPTYEAPDNPYASIAAATTGGSNYWYGWDGAKWSQLGSAHPVDGNTYTNAIEFSVSDGKLKVKYSADGTELGIIDRAVTNELPSLTKLGFAGFGKFNRFSGDGLSSVTLTTTLSEGELVEVAGLSTNDYSSAAAALAGNGVNGLPQWQSIVLGLNPSVKTSKPFVAPVQNADPTKLSFSVGNYVANTNLQGVKAKFQVYEVTSTGVKVESGLNSEAAPISESATIDAGRIGTGVKYFKIKITFEKE